MHVVTTLEAFEDDRGNRIEFDGRVEKQIRVKFKGRNNVLRVASQQNIAQLFVDFDCDNGLLEIGSSTGVPALRAAIRVGDGCTVTIGRNVSSTTTVAMSTAEGTSITIGDDVMIASDIQIRADDGHPIFDVRTGRRVNVSRSIVIGDHVWLGLGSCVLGGATIGDGTVVGMRSIVTRSLPNNVVAAGSPAKVVKRHIAWERPHLTLTAPFRKPTADSVKKSSYWNLTADGAGEPKPPRSAYAAARRRTKKALKRVRAKVARTVA
jgi:acetyltransferase-like isoleucine patch superfamily enzyme